jgi:hypothetical protein
MRESDKINPFASPAPEAEKDFQGQLSDSLEHARTERARWTAICMLNGSAVFVVGILLVNAGSTSERDNAFFATVGTVLIAVAVVVFFLGPMLWYWLRKDQV